MAGEDVADGADAADRADGADVADMADATNGHHATSQVSVAHELTREAEVTPAGSRELRTAAELVRRADWPRLPARERAALLAPYAGLVRPRPAREAKPRALPDENAQQAWVADLVREQLQRAPVALVRTWLADSATNTHLYISSASGRGRTSVVTTLARRAMEHLPAAPDYCYVPDPTALGHNWLLALPAGTGAPFAEALTSALRVVLHNWEKPRERLHVAPEEEPDETVVRARLVGASLRSIAQQVPEVARPYVERLGAALTAMCANFTPPGVAEIDLPAGRIQVPALDAASLAALPLVASRNGEPGPPTHPPVIVGSLARMDLTRSLLRANGGVLVLLAADFVDRDQVTSEFATLRAVLQAGVVYARGAGEPGIPITTRVVLIGAYAPYRVLERAEGFLRLFRYKVHFQDSVEWTPATEAAYAALLAGTAQYYGLPSFDPAAVGALIEEGARRALQFHRGYVTTDLLALRDLAMEAGRLAQARLGTEPVAAQDGAKAGHAWPRVPDAMASAPSARVAKAGSKTLRHTTAAEVEAAIAARHALQGETAREAREAVLRQHILVATTGSAVGEINGLTISTAIPVESHYGLPFRLSVSVSPGSERLVDIERESETADSTHISGALTMAGYLAWRYGRQRPISVVARLRFEQEHGYTSGPSASAAELFALLSALAQVPIRRSLAVTGAVGQHGEVQMIGGTNEKIEGFWEICRARRAQGEEPDSAYGVLIPLANRDDLMLSPPVVASIVQEGWFHIWPIADIDAGLPLLTGLPAAEVHARVDQRLQAFFELARQLASH